MTESQTKIAPHFAHANMQISANKTDVNEFFTHIVNR